MIYSIYSIRSTGKEDQSVGQSLCGLGGGSDLTQIPCIKTSHWLLVDQHTNQLTVIVLLPLGSWLPLANASVTMNIFASKLPRR